MRSDQEYLASAGVTDEASAPSTPETTPQTTESKTETPTQTAQQAIEMFELNGNKFPVTSEFNFTHDGKPIKKSYNELVNTYRQATHLQNKWTEGKKLFDSRQDYDKFKGFYDKYGALQDWSEKNPQDWQRLYDLWQNKDKHLLAAQVAPGAEQNPNLNPLVEKLTNLEKELNDLRSVKKSFEERAQQEKEAKDMDFVKSEVISFTKKFREIDLAEVDPDGVPLWAKIVNWGVQQGYNDFTSAAKMYLGDRIEDVLVSRGRTEATKTVKQEHQNGIIKRSATPITSGQGQPAVNTKKMSYGELAELAKSGQLAMG